jgi:hypothetical protein
MSDIFNPLFSTRCRRPSAIATATLPNRKDQENVTQIWPWGEKGGGGGEDILHKVYESVIELY